MKAKNPNQIINRFDVGRNEPCPCGSGKKLKKCCKTQYLFSAKRILNWLKINDTTPPDGVDYNSITDQELEVLSTIQLLVERKEEVEDAMRKRVPEKSE